MSDLEIAHLSSSSWLHRLLKELWLLTGEGVIECDGSEVDGFFFPLAFSD